VAGNAHVHLIRKDWSRADTERGYGETSAPPPPRVFVVFSPRLGLHKAEPGGDTLNGENKPLHTLRDLLGPRKEPNKSPGSETWQDIVN
jgi:hypothetical protein